MLELIISSSRQQRNQTTLFGILKKAHFVLLLKVVIITFFKFRWNIGSSKIITYPWLMNFGVGDKSGFVAMDFRILAFYKISSISAISSAISSVTYLYFFVLVKLLDADLLLWSLRIEKSLKTLSSPQSAFPGAPHSVTICVVLLFGPCMEGKKLFDLEQCRQRPVKYKLNDFNFFSTILGNCW